MSTSFVTRFAAKGAKKARAPKSFAARVLAGRKSDHRLSARVLAPAR